MRDSLLKLYEKHEKNEGEPVDAETRRSLASQAAFFTSKLGPKIGNSTRTLSTFMSIPGKMHWVALERLLVHVKGMYLNVILHL